MFSRRRITDDNVTDDEDDRSIDPELRLRTVRTAASTLAESAAVEQRAEKRKTLLNKGKKKGSFFRRGSEKKRPTQDSVGPTGPVIPGQRRTIHVNRPLPMSDVDSKNEPLVRYPRNKVRTTSASLSPSPASPKSSRIFQNIPSSRLYQRTCTNNFVGWRISISWRWLFSKVRCVNRILSEILTTRTYPLPVFPMFGAASPQTAALPLIFIITVTAIKDGIEDYRRAQVDEEVNTSAATKLGDWKNVNCQTDPREWYEKLLGINPPGKVTKGVQKLRQREAGEGMQIVLSKSGSDASSLAQDYTSIRSAPTGPGGRRLEDIQSVDSHSYPPNSIDASRTTLVGSGQGWKSEVFEDAQSWNPSGSVHSLPRAPPRSSAVDHRRRAVGQAKWERTLWKKLEVGDIVVLRDNNQIPADIVVLSTSDPEGMCFVETKNLDGETNLKPRKSVSATSNIVSEEDLERLSFLLDCEPPHQNLYSHQSILRYNDSNGENKQESVTINELLLRGCTVRNTDWIIGLVVYTGADSKIMLNGGATPSKRSKIEKETNFNVIVNFVVLMMMCLITAICGGIWEGKTGTSADIFEVGSRESSSIAVGSVITFVYVPSRFCGGGIHSTDRDLVSVSSRSKTSCPFHCTFPLKSSRQSRLSSSLKISTCTTNPSMPLACPRLGTYPTISDKSNISSPIRPAPLPKISWSSRNVRSTV